MNLTKLTIANFRSYREPTTLHISDFTALIGRNDVGKSTLLEALEIFFNNKTVKIDKNDPSLDSENSIVEISCTFADFPEQLTIDERSETTLEEERLLNENGELEIVKHFDCRSSIKETIYARAYHPTTDSVRDLLQLKNAELKGRANAVGASLTGVDQRSNVSLRKAIREQVPELNLATSLIELAKEDGKKVWAQLSTHMPIFALFQADRPSKEDDPEAVDPMKVAVAAAMQTVEEQLEQIRESVREQVSSVARRTLEKLKEIDPDIAQTLSPTLKAQPKWEAFKVSLASDDQVPVNKRGSGVRRLILLSFFRAESERRRSGNTSNVIYAVEEPEVSQHPDNQKMLVRALQSLSTSEGNQVLMTTHVPGIAELIDVQDIRFVAREDGQPSIRTDEGVLDHIADTLGVLPDRRACFAIYLEGPTDVEAMKAFSRIYCTNDPSFIDIANDHRVVFVLTGGGTLKHWVDNRYLERARFRECHIYDRDDRTNPPYASTIAGVNARNNGDFGYLTSKREIENYVPEHLLNRCFGTNITYNDWDDVPSLLAEAIHNDSESTKTWDQLDSEKQSKKVSRVKKRIAYEVMPKMSRADLESKDLDREVRDWLQRISEAIQALQ